MTIYCIQCVKPHASAHKPCFLHAMCRPAECLALEEGEWEKYHGALQDAYDSLMDYPGCERRSIMSYGFEAADVCFSIMAKLHNSKSIIQDYDKGNDSMI